jgi:hypothetical protein
MTQEQAISPLRLPPHDHVFCDRQRLAKLSSRNPADLVAGILDQYGRVVGVTDAAERPST